MRKRTNGAESMNEDNSLQRYHEADAEGKNTIVVEELMRLFAERLPNADITGLKEFIAPKHQQETEKEK